MKKLIFSIVVLAVAFVSSAQVQTGSFVFEGQLRDYLVFLPQNYAPNMPVVFNLHGYTDNANWQMDYSLMNNVADTAGFIVVYPNSVPPAFYTGIYVPGWPPIQKINDVGFISALIDTLKEDYDIDMSRIYTCGYSNGGFMTLRLARQLSHRFAAGASVAGVMLDSIIHHSNFIRPFPMLFCHGTGDGVVPYYGSPSWDSWTVDETINLFVQNNNCISEPDTIHLPDLDPTDGSTVEKIIFTDCSDQTSIIFYKVIDGGHTWPGGAEWGFGNEGNKNFDINTNLEIWNFFKNFENPLVNMAFGKTMEINYEYLSSEVGSALTIIGNIANPENHEVTIMAHIEGLGNSYRDSIQLYDDGLHGDKENADNTFGNRKEFEGLQEGTTYTVQISAFDQTEVTTQYLYPESYFTTIGPVVFNAISFDPNDSIPNPDDLLKVYISLRNNGAVTAARNISAKLISLDPLITVTSEVNDFPDILAGEAVQCSRYSRLNISADCPGNTEIPLALEISSDNYLFWRDTFSILIQPLALDDIREPIRRIYPNPATDQLIIEFDKVESQVTSIILYDFTGKVVHSETLTGSAHLVHTINLASFEEGLYLINISNDQYSYTEKVIKVESK